MEDEIALVRRVNREKFFDVVRATFFKGKISQLQVNGMETILYEWEKRGLTDLRWLAYMLATAYHETAKTMQPIEEYGKGKGHEYGKPSAITGLLYYGRGFVQLTWDYNYRHMGDLLGVNLLKNPELALDCTIATNIMFEGMLQGTFTGKKLADYFNEKLEMWRSARRIINGLDCADLIARYGQNFLKALK